MTTLLIRMQVLPEKEERFLEHIRAIVASMPGHEPDTRVYAFWKTKTPHEYFMVESYTNAEALKFHISRHIDGQKVFQTFLAKPPEVEELGDFVVGVPDVGTLPLA
jgi:quinol monooxygenase YgiN